MIIKTSDEYLKIFPITSIYSLHWVDIKPRMGGPYIYYRYVQEYHGQPKTIEIDLLRIRLK